MDYDPRPPWRDRFTDQAYTSSFTAEGGERPVEPAPRGGRASTVLAAVHFPTSIFVIDDTLSQTFTASADALHLSHAEVAGVAILAVSAAVAFAELFRSAAVAATPLVQRLRFRRRS